MDVSPLLLTTKAAAEWLSLGESTVRQMLANGTLASVTIGRARRVQVSVLVSYIETLRREQE